MSEVSRSDERRAEQRAEAVRKAQRAERPLADTRAHEPFGGARSFADLLARTAESRSAVGLSRPGAGRPTMSLSIGSPSVVRRVGAAIPLFAEDPQLQSAVFGERGGAFVAREEAARGLHLPSLAAEDVDDPNPDLGEPVSAGGLKQVPGGETLDPTLLTSLGGVAGREPDSMRLAPLLDADQIAKLQRTMELVRTGGGATELVVDLKGQIGRPCELRIQCVGEGVVALRLGGPRGSVGAARAAIRQLVLQLERDGLRIAGAGWVPES